MSEKDKELFKGEDVDVDFYDVDPRAYDASGLRGDMVRDLSGVHDEVRSVLSYGWDFEPSPVIPGGISGFIMKVIRVELMSVVGLMAV